MRHKRLSVIPYYGGKSRMSDFISQRLDYDNTNTYVEPFGGGGRVLLNKPRHPTEVYNDLDVGVCTLFEVLSKPKLAEQLIQTLYYETEFSLEQFEWAQKVYRSCTWDFERQFRKKLKDYLKEHIKLTKGNPLLSQTAEKIIQILWPVLEVAYNDADKAGADLTQVCNLSLLAPQSVIGNKQIGKTLDNALNVLFAQLSENAGFRNGFENRLADWSCALWMKENKSLPKAQDMSNLNYTDIDLAIATYITFTQSRDGMGLAFSPQKFQRDTQYRNRIVNLYECAERLEGVQIHEIDGNVFSQTFMFIDWYQEIGQITARDFKAYLNQWIHRNDVMIYADPSYIDPESEKTALAGITESDIAKNGGIAEAIKNKGRPLPKNAGAVYTRSFTYEEQEAFVRSIQMSGAHILLSNYDLFLYDYYLTSELGWRREEFETTTSVGGKAGNKRTEVIWMNY